VQLCMQPYMLVLSHAGTPAGSGSSIAGGGQATTALQRWDILVRLYAISSRYLVYVTMMLYDDGGRAAAPRTTCELSDSHACHACLR